jgi:hypothetical protein
MAGGMPDPTHLPKCHSFIGADVTCRLPVKNATFDSLDAWTALGRVSHGTEGGTSFASLTSGGSVQQAVYAMFYKWSGAAYALRFRVRSTSGDAQVYAALSMSDDIASRTAPIGSTSITASEGEWRTVELFANGKPFPAPAHVLVEITNTGGENATIQVDDVFLVESADADVIEVR